VIRGVVFTEAADFAGGFFVDAVDLFGLGPEGAACVAGVEEGLLTFGSALTDATVTGAATLFAATLDDSRGLTKFDVLVETSASAVPVAAGVSTDTSSTGLGVLPAAVVCALDAETSPRSGNRSKPHCFHANTPVTATASSARTTMGQRPDDRDEDILTERNPS
jgi:hypothetical protein